MGLFIVFLSSVCSDDRGFAFKFEGTDGAKFSDIFSAFDDNEWRGNEFCELSLEDGLNGDRSVKGSFSESCIVFQSQKLLDKKKLYEGWKKTVRLHGISADRRPPHKFIVGGCA